MQLFSFTIERKALREAQLTGSINSILIPYAICVIFSRLKATHFGGINKTSIKLLPLNSET